MFRTIRSRLSRPPERWRTRRSEVCEEERRHHAARQLRLLLRLIEPLQIPLGALTFRELCVRGREIALDLRFVDQPRRGDRAQA